MVLRPCFGMPVPMLPQQILSVNLVTGGHSAQALAVDPGEPRS